MRLKELRGLEAEGDRKMQELIFWDTGVTKVWNGEVTCFVEDILSFTGKWSSLVGEERTRRFLNSIEGKGAGGNLLTDKKEDSRYEEDDEEHVPEGVLLRDEKTTQVLQERKTELKNVTVCFEKGRESPVKLVLKRLEVKIRYIKYGEEYIRLLTYYARGIARHKSVERKEGCYERIECPRNSLVQYERNATVVSSDNAEDFAKETVQLLVWYPMGYATSGEELQEVYGKQMRLTHQDLEQLLQELITDEKIE